MGDLSGKRTDVVGKTKGSLSKMVKLVAHSCAVPKLIEHLLTQLTVFPINIHTHGTFSSVLSDSIFQFVPVQTGCRRPCSVLFL